MEEGEGSVQSPRDGVKAAASSAPLPREGRKKQPGPQGSVVWTQAWLAPGGVLRGSYSERRREELKILNS